MNFLQSFSVGTLKNFLVKPSYPQVIFLLSVLWVALANQSFFGSLSDIYPLELSQIGFYIAVTILLFGSTLLLLSLLVFHRVFKPILIVLLMATAASAYFMDSYHSVIDESMLTNVMKTDQAEAMDLFSVKLLAYLLLLGVLPSIWIYRARIEKVVWKKAILQRVTLSIVGLALMIGSVMSFSDQFSSFFREHKQVRYYANPGFYIYSVGRFTGDAFAGQAEPFQQIGLDAKSIAKPGAPRKLVVFVVGETARGDHFSVNGYQKETTPNLQELIQKGTVANFNDVTSCGTSTAISVPCMFSVLDESDFSRTKANAQDNVLDMLQRTGVNVLWLDNNSDSKGVALRVPYQSYKTSDNNPVCDLECRDEGMLASLDEFVAQNAQGDIFIVLHQMGNHGPAYYKRYPEKFNKFTPTCNTNELANCSSEALNNTYDNAILYTDDFLAKTVAWLQNYSQFDTAMIYASDHGESLGENGIYLHGLPNFMAPSVQRDVPAFVWMADKQSEKLQAAQQKQNIATSHDALFHSILGLMDVRTELYQPELDWFAAKKQ